MEKQKNPNPVGLELEFPQKEIKNPQTNALKRIIKLPKFTNE
jgi:hypothetical protein